jgi:hypothetical protein
MSVRRDEQEARRQDRVAREQANYDERRRRAFNAKLKAYGDAFVQFVFEGLVRGLAYGIGGGAGLAIIGKLFGVI